MRLICIPEGVHVHGYLIHKIIYTYVDALIKFTRMGLTVQHASAYPHFRRLRVFLSEAQLLENGE